jgi:hypothetical protein
MRLRDRYRYPFGELWKFHMGWQGGPDIREFSDSLVAVVGFDRNLTPYVPMQGSCDSIRANFI